jgi:NTP pyrophosphatase (non-canonical NTP hydrolase)
MTFDDYQIQALKTAVYPKQGENIFYPTIGLAGEVGELANKVKKLMRGDYDLRDSKDAISAELGDVLWYCAAIASELNISLGAIAQYNLFKLAKRMDENKIKGSGDTR